MNKRVLIVGAGSAAAGIAALLAAKNVEAVVLVDAPQRAPRRLVDELATVDLEPRAPFAMTTEGRRRAQWKDEIHGRKKP